VKRGPAKANVRYIRRAAKRFLEGTRCRTPEEAVLKGFRTLEGWTDVLRAEREAARAARHQTEPFGTESSFEQAA
jgi:hypothetical protein